MASCLALWRMLVMFPSALSVDVSCETKFETLCPVVFSDAIVERTDRSCAICVGLSEGSLSDLPDEICAPSCCCWNVRLSIAVVWLSNIVEVAMRISIYILDILRHLQDRPSICSSTLMFWAA